MSYKRFNKIVLLWATVFSVSFYNVAIAENYQLVGIRIDFELDDDLATAGDGKFVSSLPDNDVCDGIILDPPPHNKNYFESHFEAAKKYWEKVSNNQLVISKADVFPSGINQVYSTEQPMLSYHPFLEDFDETELLYRLAKEAIELSDDDIDFNEYNTVIIFHAGLGGDFDFVLDPTPGSIPSAYLTQDDLDMYGGIHVDNMDIQSVIILPESQNFLEFEETKNLFAEASDPCFYQFGLNGTMALMLGFHFGMEPMYDTDTGESLLGKFALMDQGSNNFHGIVPAFPNPYTRIKKGWATPKEINIGDHVTLAINSEIAKLNINDHEYYLIENHLRNAISPPQLTEFIDTLLQDTVSIEFDVNGVALDVDENSGGMPGNGLLIWHIDESAKLSDDNPNGGAIQLVDVVEADGAQDIGFETQLLFADFLTTGWWFDYWFAGNEGWFDLNKRLPIVGDSLLCFTDATNPSTKNSSGKSTRLGIENISRIGSVMSFDVTSSRFVNTKSLHKIVGFYEQNDKSVVIELDENSDAINTYEVDLSNTLNSLASLQIHHVFDGDTLFNEKEFLFLSSIESDSSYIYNLITHAMTRFPYTISSDVTILNNQIYLTVQGDTLSQLTLDADRLNIIETNTYDANYLTLLPYYSTSNSVEVAYLLDNELNLGNHVITNVKSVKSISQMDNGTSKTLFFVQSIGNDLMLMNSDASIYLTMANVQNYLPIPIDSEKAGFIVWDNYAINAFDWNGHSLLNFPVTLEEEIQEVLVSIEKSTNKTSLFVIHDDTYTIVDINGKIIERGYTNFNGASLGYKNLLSDGHVLLNFTDFSNSEFLWASSNQVNTSYELIAEDYSTDLFDKSQTFNYPNPTDGSSTTIRTWIGNASEMAIQIYSLTGALIKSVNLVDLNLNGVNEWEWNVSEVPNGVYYANISVKTSDKEDNKIIKIVVTH